MARVLVVDDEAGLRRILAVVLREDGHAVTEAPGVAEARRQLRRSQFDLVITDQKMPDGEGLGLLADCREADPTLPVVMVTAYATVELAVEAMRQGAFDFITKPFVPDTVRAVVRRACERTDLVRTNESLRGAVRRMAASGQLIGEAASMRAVREMMARVAPSAVTVLITGETGTGKELVARAIHEASPRAERPFFPVNCAAFTESLLENELFGHEKGAFTGADRVRRGLFEAADGGTLFLDEAGEMSLPLQAKLLRVLMDGEFYRLGATTPRLVDVRVIAATHRDLQQRVREGLFREDLYYRLAVVPIHVPALREHMQDLPLLVEHLLEEACRDLKLPTRRLSEEAVRTLSRYEFPGNVRELRNILERACILSKGDRIGTEDLVLRAGMAGASAPDPREAFIASLPAQISLRATLEELERDLLRRSLEAAGGVQAEAARRLGLSRSDLAYKVKKYTVEG